MILALALACASCAPPPAVAVDAACSVTDGDTIRCGDERIRLLGIDAPEMGGRCREGRVCVATTAMPSAVHGRTPRPGEA
ncbi:MAG: hypothetical protein WA842_06275 [Croceibacterium sp.]